MGASDPRFAALPAGVQRAMAATAMSSQALTAKVQADAMKAQQEALQSIQKPTRFTSDLEINDYPQAARFKVLQRESLVAIQEWTKVAITTKGAYYPPGRNPRASASSSCSSRARRRRRSRRRARRCGASSRSRR